jgi:pimeloyl-ACP methyl ester carboxylesterase
VPHFDAAGPLDAPAIILVHGSVVTRTIWLPQLGGLAADFRVIAPDLPAHGSRANLPFNFDGAVQMLADLIQDEARGRAIVAGLSLGGYVAIDLARRYPGAVTGLVLSGCSVNFVGVLGVYLKGVSWLMQHGWLTQSRERAEQRTRKIFPAALADVADAQIRAGVYPESLGAAFAELAGRDFTALLRAYPGPCLFLNGEYDRPSRRGEAAFVAASRHGRAQVVPGARHACNLDNPDAYNAAVRGFAKGLQ